MATLRAGVGRGMVIGMVVEVVGIIIAREGIIIIIIKCAAEAKYIIGGYLVFRHGHGIAAAFRSVGPRCNERIY